MLKDKIFFTTAIAKQISLFAWLVKLFHINQTKTIFLVRLRCSNRRLTRKLFHIRQTKLSGYSTSGRIKPSCYSSLLFRRLFHIALNINVATQRMGNGNKVLHTEPSKSQYSISPLVLVIFKSPTPTVVTISPLNNPTCTNGRCKLL